MTPTEVMIREAYFKGYGNFTGFTAAAQAVDEFIVKRLAEERQQHLAARADISDLKDIIEEMHEALQKQANYISTLKATQVEEVVAPEYNPLRFD